MNEQLIPGRLRRPLRDADAELALSAEKARLARESADQARQAAQTAADEAEQPPVVKPTTQKAKANWVPKKAATMTAYPEWVTRSKPRSKGPRQLLWWLWVTLRLYKLKWIPQPRSHGTHFGRVFEMGKWLMDYRHVTHAIIVVFTTKGGACKTTTATWPAAIRSALIKLVVIIVDTDSGGGKVLKRFQLDPQKAMTTQSLVKRRGNITYEELIRSTETDPSTGVVTIHSPPGAEFEGDTLGVTLVRLHKESHTVVVDCGPGFGKPNTESALKCADVIEIPADFRSGDDLDDVLATLDHEPYNLRKEGIKERVLVVVSAVRWRHFNYRTQFELATRYQIEPDQVVLIPYSRYFQQTRPVNLGKLRSKQNFAYTLLDFRAGQILEKYGRRKLPDSFGQHTRPQVPQAEPTGWVNNVTSVTSITGSDVGSTNGFLGAQERGSHATQ